MTEPVVIALVGAVPALISVLVPLLVSRRTADGERRKAEAEADATAAGAWRELYNPMRAELDQLRDTVSELYSRVFEQEQQLAAQRSQLEQQEQHEAMLREKLAEVFDWAEDGAVPPPPKRPSWLIEKGK